jgi:hypothetical protein
VFDPEVGASVGKHGLVDRVEKPRLGIRLGAGHYAVEDHKRVGPEMNKLSSEMLQLPGAVGLRRVATGIAVFLLVRESDDAADVAKGRPSSSGTLVQRGRI